MLVPVTCSKRYVVERIVIDVVYLQRDVILIVLLPLQRKVFFTVEIWQNELNFNEIPIHRMAIGESFSLSVLEWWTYRGM